MKVVPSREIHIIRDISFVFVLEINCERFLIRRVIGSFHLRISERMYENFRTYFKITI